MSVGRDLVARVEGRILEVVTLLRSHPDCVSEFKVPSFLLNIRGSVGGWAISDSHLIRLNPVFLKNYTEDYLENVIPHEIAHLFVSQFYKDLRPKSHGSEWKSVMGYLGLKPRRCHGYKTEGSVIYRCRKGCSYNLGKRVHKKIQRGAVYRCRTHNYKLKELR